jgi:hypothetical protein
MIDESFMKKGLMADGTSDISDTALGAEVNGDNVHDNDADEPEAVYADVAGVDQRGEEDAAGYDGVNEEDDGYGVQAEGQQDVDYAAEDGNEKLAGRDQDVGEPYDDDGQGAIVRPDGADNDNTGNGDNGDQVGVPEGHSKRSRKAVIDGLDAKAIDGFPAEPVRQDGSDQSSERARSQRVAWLAVGGLGFMVAYSWRRRLARVINSLLRGP